MRARGGKAVLRTERVRLDVYFLFQTVFRQSDPDSDSLEYNPLERASRQFGFSHQELNAERVWLNVSLPSLEALCRDFFTI